MFQNYLKTVVRNFLKNKWYTGINLLGLSIGFAAFVLICIYIHHETHFENFHTKADRIHRLTYKTKSGPEFSVHWARVPVNYVNELPSHIPEIQSLIRFQNQDRKYVRVGTEKFRPKYAYTTDKAVFDVFDFKLASGDPQTALAQPHSVVITQQLAHKYFGKENPVGQEIFINSSFVPEEVGYQVTGVMEDLPSHTHMPVDMLLSFGDESERQGWAFIYTLLKEGASIEAVEAKMPGFMANYLDEASIANVGYEYQPLKDIHLHSHLAREIVPNGNALYVRIFFFVAIFIIAIALINFINLNSALSIGRSKEFGVRKILGARLRHNLLYALTESVGYNFMALALGGVLAYFAFPYFQQLTGSGFTMDMVPFGLFLAAIALLGGGLAAIYPAIVLNALKLSTMVKASKALRVSNFPINIKSVLLSLQFCASIILIGGALAAYQQVKYLNQKKLGLKKEQIITLPALPDVVTADYRSFKEKVKNLGGVQSVTACMQTPSEEIRDSGPVLVKGVNSDPSDAPMMDVQVIDGDFIDMMEIEFLAGHVPGHEFVLKPIPEFSEALTLQDYLKDRSRSYVINETAMKQLGWTKPEEAIGREINWSIASFELAMGPITGVVKDFHQESLKNKIDPLVMFFEPIWLRTFMVKLEADEMASTIQQVGSAWDETFPKYPFEYYFLDEMFDKLYKSERVQVQLLSWFSLLSIFIAAIGLFSLVAYNLRTRVKEMAIRKVLGAELKDLVQLISKGYIWIVLLSGCLAIPVSYLGVNKWLENFAYRTDLSPAIYLVPILLIVMALLLIISIQTFWSNKTNPAESLKEE